MGIPAGVRASGDPPATAGALNRSPDESRRARLAQRFEEIRALLADYRTAQGNEKDLAAKRNTARATAAATSEHLSRIGPEVSDLRRITGPAIVPRRTQLEAELRLAQERLGAAMQALTTLEPQWAAATQQLANLTRVIQERMPKYREEWLWLCDPFGRFGPSVHRNGIEFFSQVIRTDPTFALAYLGRSFAYLHTDRPVDALTDAEAALQLDENLADVVACVKGWSLARTHADGPAAEQFRKALQVKHSPFAELVLSSVYLDRRIDTLAEEHFRKAVDLGGNLPQAREALAGFLATHRRGDQISLKQAIQHATKACEQTDWRQWMYLDTLAMACAAVGDFHLASQWGRKAVDYAPRDCRSGLQARLKLYQARWAGAIPSVGMLTDNRPHSHVGLPPPRLADPAGGPRYLGGMQSLLEAGLDEGGDAARVRPCYDAVKALGPSDARLSLAWGLVCLKQGQLDDAQRQFEQALEAADERYLPAWQALVRTQILQGRPAAARHSLILLAVAFDRPENRAFSEDWTAEYENWWTQAVAFIDENFDPDAQPAVQPGDGQRQDAPDAKRPGGMAARPAGVGRAEQKLTREQREAAAQQAEQAKLDRDKAALETDRKALESAHQEQVGKIDEYLATLNVRYNQLQFAADRLAADASAKGLIPPRQHDHMVDEMLKIERQVKLLRQQRAARFNQTATHAERLGGTEASLAKRERALARAEGQRRVRGVQAGPPAQRPAPAQADMDLRFPLDYEAEAQRILASYLVHPTMSAPTQRLLDSPPSAKK
jgi:Tfp pilus assembly protein PilF